MDTKFSVIITVISVSQSWVRLVNKIRFCARAGGGGRKMSNLGNLGKKNGKFGEFKPKFAIICQK